MDLSVVISTWNNAARLRRTLEGLCRLNAVTEAQWELVLVNNRCTDDTDAVASEFQTQLPMVYLHEPRPGISHGRNAGIAAAAGRLILFSDDDVDLPSNWINAYWQAYRQRPQGYFFGGSIESAYEAEPPPPDLARLAPPSVRGLDLGPMERVLEAGEEFVGANWACPADALAAVGGFDPELGLNPARNLVRIGEESDLMNRLRSAGWLPWHLPRVKLRHFVPREKCRASHILGRCEAHVRQDTLAEFTRCHRRPASAMELIPLRLRAAEAWLKWKAAPLARRTGLWSRAQYHGRRQAIAVLKMKNVE